MAKKKIKWSVVSVKTWGDNWQSNDYDEILKSGEHKLRIRMHHDWCYSKQCWAKVERWDGTKWHNVVSGGRPSFLSTGADYGNRNTIFGPMRNKLLAEAEAVIF